MTEFCQPDVLVSLCPHSNEFNQIDMSSQFLMQHLGHLKIYLEQGEIKKDLFLI